MAFYEYLPDSDGQTEAQRKLVVLYHEWETESDPEAREPNH